MLQLEGALIGACAKSDPPARLILRYALDLVLLEQLKETPHSDEACRTAMPSGPSAPAYACSWQNID